MSELTRTDVCRFCGSEFTQPRKKGRPRLVCWDCARRGYQRAYCEANREEIAEKKRAYREAKRNGSRKAGSRFHCKECNEPLREQTADGLCGFCRLGIPA